MQLRPLEAADPTTYRYLVESKDASWDLRFSALDGSRLTGHDALAAIGLMPAMTRGEALQIDAPISADLLHRLPELQEGLSSWIPWLRRVEVHAEDAPVRDRPPGRGMALFFTGGVDSFYTLLNNRGRFDSLLYVHGYDVALDDRAKRDLVSAHMRAVAEAEGLELIEIESDVRRLSDRNIPWGLYYGCGLAAVAHLLSDRFESVVVPSGLGSRITPWSWALMSLWGVPGLALGVDPVVSRPEKVTTISTDPMAQRHLRVCWHETPEYNCGRCEKCLRTMVVLDAVGELDRFAVFPRRPTALRLALVDLTRPVEASRASTRTNIAFLKHRGLRPSWRLALRAALVRGSVWKLLQDAKALASRLVRRSPSP